MMQARVKRLNLRLSDADAAIRARFLVEEALRLSGHDGGDRFVILRKLDLGQIDQGLNARTSELLRDMIARAVPAASEQSARAEAVFFESREAAQASLLEQLLRGVEPFAWFWPRAVPEWRRGDASAIPRLLISLQRTPKGRIKLGKVVQHLAQTGALAVLLRVLDEPTCNTLLDIWPGRVALKTEVSVPKTTAETFDTVRAARRADQQHVVNEIYIRVRNTLHRQLPTTSAARRWLITALVPAIFPHMVEGQSAFAEIMHRQREEEENATVKTESAFVTQEARINHVPSGPARAELELAPNLATSSEQAAAPQLPKPAEARSNAAGLFYLLRPMQRMGYDTWLKNNPRAAAEQHGLHLLREIAVRQKIPDRDPVWALLPPEKNSELDITPWRVALDRWLRRHCRMTLSRVVKRVGWIDLGEDSVTVRFPLESADVRLRRKGIDLDPGLVVWLGRSVRFIYEDRQ